MDNSALVKILASKLDFYDKVDTLAQEAARLYVENDTKPSEALERVIRAIAILYGKY